MLIIGDIHGNSGWKQILNKYWENDYNKPVVFLGDYFDSFIFTDNQIYINAKEIFELAKNDEHVHLCLGNHDFHYLFDYVRYSGYSFEYAHIYNKLMLEYLDLFNIVIDTVCCDKKYLISHAGITNTWLNENNIKLEDVNIDLLIKRPEIFDFIYKPYSNPYGDDTHQGPLWVRPNSLEKDYLEGYSQIVGHTIHNEIKTTTLKDDNTITYVCGKTPQYIILN